MGWGADIMGVEHDSESGGELDSTGLLKCEWRVVVGQLAT